MSDNGPLCDEVETRDASWTRFDNRMKNMSAANSIKCIAISLTILCAHAKADVLNAIGDLMSQSSQQPHPAIVQVLAKDQVGLAKGSGSLVYVDAEYGYILTNWHVVRDGEQIDVLFPDGFASPGTTVKMDENWDLAVVRIWKPNVRPLLVAGVVPRVGDVLTIAGYGQGSFRAVSGKCLHYAAPDAERPFEMVEVSVEARQGDSGGPILNQQGELAGVLFGAGDGATTGSHIGRVKTFLDQTFIEQQQLAQRQQKLAGTLPATSRTPAVTGKAAQLPPAFIPPATTGLESGQPLPVPSPNQKLVDVPPSPAHPPSVQLELPAAQSPFNMPMNPPIAEQNSAEPIVALSPAELPEDPQIEFPAEMMQQQVTTLEPLEPLLPLEPLRPPQVPARQNDIARQPLSSSSPMPLPRLSVPGQANELYGTRGFSLDRTLAQRLWEATKSVLAIVGAITIIFQFAKASLRKSS